MESEKFHFVLAHDEARKRAAQKCMDAPAGWHVKITPPTRTLDQNAAQWPFLEGFSRQLQWPVNGVLCKLSPEEWKDILTAAFEKETNPRMAAGFDGGVVMLGRRTSKFGKKKFSEWYEFLCAAASLKGVAPVYKNGDNHEQEN